MIAFSPFSLFVDLQVSVSNLGGNEDYLIHAGEDIEMKASVTGECE